MRDSYRKFVVVGEGVRARRGGRQQEAFLKRLSAIMPGYGTQWHDQQSELPLAENEAVFSVRG